MNKCMEYRVEGRRPTKTWLESVEADMAELEIDREGVNGRKKINVMKRMPTLSDNGQLTDNISSTF